MVSSRVINAHTLEFNQCSWFTHLSCRKHLGDGSCYSGNHGQLRIVKQIIFLGKRKWTHIITLFVCLCNWRVRPNTLLGPEGTRRKQKLGPDSESL